MIDQDARLGAVLVVADALRHEVDLPAERRDRPGREVGDLAIELRPERRRA